MPEENSDGSKQDRHSEVVTTRVNVAFPFSRIRVEEPSAGLAALAGLVQELAELVADVAPGPKAQELAKRAQELSNSLT